MSKFVFVFFVAVLVLSARADDGGGEAGEHAEAGERAEARTSPQNCVPWKRVSDTETAMVCYAQLPSIEYDQAYYARNWKSCGTLCLKRSWCTTWWMDYRPAYRGCYLSKLPAFGYLTIYSEPAVTMGWLNTNFFG